MSALFVSPTIIRDQIKPLIPRSTDGDASPVSKIFPPPMRLSRLAQWSCSHRRSHGAADGEVSARLPRRRPSRGLRSQGPPRRRPPPAAGRGPPARGLGQAHLRRQLRGSSTLPLPSLQATELRVVEVGMEEQRCERSRYDEKWERERERDFFFFALVILLILQRETQLNWPVKERFLMKLVQIPRLGDIDFEFILSNETSNGDSVNGNCEMLGMWFSCSCVGCCRCQESLPCIHACRRYACCSNYKHFCGAYM